MREIVLDTETTGLDPETGDKVVEIGCVELIDHLPTGNEFHQYINPQRDMPRPAFEVHGLSAEFLSDFPVFKEIAPEFLDFIGNDPLVIHNAEFDLKFLNAELRICQLLEIQTGRAIDTMLMARQKFPGAQASLDALCRRFGIDNSNRKKHGALLDSQILGEVYLELIGGRQHGFELARENRDRETNGAARQSTEGGNIVSGTVSGEEKPLIRPPRQHFPSEDELQKHRQMLSLLKEPIWGE